MDSRLTAKDVVRPKRLDLIAWAIPEYICPLGARMPPRAAPWIITESFAQGHDLDPEQARYFQHFDNSMWPVKTADVAIVDLTQTHIVSGKPYLLQVDHAGATIRRVHMQSDGSMLLTPDSTSAHYRAEPVPRADLGKVRVIGRVAAWVVLDP